MEVRKDALEAIAAQIAGLSKAAWVVAPAMAEYAAKNPVFKRVEGALRRYFDQNQECLQSIHAALGGKPGTQGASAAPVKGARRVEPTRGPRGEERASPGRRRGDEGSSESPGPPRANADRRMGAQRRSGPRRRG